MIFISEHRYSENQNKNLNARSCLKILIFDNSIFSIQIKICYIFYLSDSPHKNILSYIIKENVLIDKIEKMRPNNNKITYSNLIIQNKEYIFRAISLFNKINVNFWNDAFNTLSFLTVYYLYVRMHDCHLNTVICSMYLCVLFAQFRINL